MGFFFLDNNILPQYNGCMTNLISVSRVAFVIGGREIYWYGIIMCLAIIAAIVVAMLLCKKKKYDTDLPINIALVIVPFGILGARLFACLFDSALSIADFFNFSTGGMSIMGAIVGGGLALLAFVLLKKEKRPLVYFDILCSVLILAQAIGRWGNFFNGELYGKVIEESSFFARFPFAVLIDGTHYQALFFYEFVLNLIGFAVIAVVFVRCKNEGYAMAAYLTIYGLIRTALEPLRQAQYILKLGNLPVSLAFSIAMAVCGIVMFILLKQRDLRRVKNG